MWGVGWQRPYKESSRIVSALIKALWREETAREKCGAGMHRAYLETERLVLVGAPG